MKFRKVRVVLELPKFPRRYARGNPKNYRRWHAWVEAVKVLSAWCKAQR